MTTVILLIILNISFIIALIFSIKRNKKPSWTYNLIDNSNRGPNADQGYWVTQDASGRECWFTDDSITTARSRANKFGKT